MTAAHLHAGSGARLGHSNGRRLWKYPAAGQQFGQVNIKEIVALSTLPYSAEVNNVI